MSKEVGVKSLTIKIGAREISLDVAEAKKLILHVHLAL